MKENLENVNEIKHVLTWWLMITILLGCKNRVENSSDSFNVKDSLSMDIESLTELKPNNLVEAVCMLDYILKDSVKENIINSSTGELYFTLELYLRNQWVRNGSRKFNEQLFVTLKIDHIDHSSGLIMDLYKYHLTSDSIYVSTILNFEPWNNDTKKVKDEFIVLLNKIKKCDCGEIIEKKLTLAEDSVGSREVEVGDEAKAE